MKDSSKRVLAHLIAEPSAGATIADVIRETGLSEMSVGSSLRMFTRIGYALRKTNRFYVTENGKAAYSGATVPRLDPNTGVSLADMSRRLEAFEAQSDALAVDYAALARRIEALESMVLPLSKR